MVGWFLWLMVFESEKSSTHVENRTSENPALLGDYHRPTEPELGQHRKKTKESFDPHLSNRSYSQGRDGTAGCCSSGLMVIVPEVSAHKWISRDLRASRGRMSRSVVPRLQFGMHLSSFTWNVTLVFKTSVCTDVLDIGNQDQ